MGSFGLSVRGMVGLVAAVGFDLAVLVRAYQHGWRAGMVGPYLVGFGLILLLVNLIGVQLALVAARLRQLPPGERLSSPVSPVVMLAMYLAVLLIPILAILFLRPGTF